jgi:Tfp pilus assembly protein PilF
VKKILAIVLILISVFNLSSAPSKKVNPEKLFKEAERYLYKGQYELARKSLSKYVKAEKDDADGWSMYAFANRKLKKYDAAEKYYKKALNLDPEHKQALEYQGELFVELGDIASAENNLSLLAELCPNSCEEYEMLEKYISGASVKSW